MTAENEVQFFVSPLPFLQSVVDQLLLSPCLRASKVIALPYSRSLSPYFEEVVNGAPFETIMGCLLEAGLITSPTKQWKQVTKRLLEGLRQVKRDHPDVAIECFKPDGYEEWVVHTSTEIAALVMRAGARGRVDVSEWRSKLLESLDFEDTVEEEIERLHDIACRRGFPVFAATWGTCVPLLRKLRSRGFRARAIYPVKPYVKNPLEELETLVYAKGAKGINDQLLEDIAKRYVDYVREYVMKTHSVDEAYALWIRKEISKKLRALLTKQS